MDGEMYEKNKQEWGRGRAEVGLIFSPGSSCLRLVHFIFNYLMYCLTSRITSNSKNISIDQNNMCTLVK